MLGARLHDAHQTRGDAALRTLGPLLPSPGLCSPSAHRVLRGLRFTLLRKQSPSVRACPNTYFLLAVNAGALTSDCNSLQQNSANPWHSSVPCYILLLFGKQRKHAHALPKCLQSIQSPMWVAGTHHYCLPGTHKQAAGARSQSSWLGLGLTPAGEAIWRMNQWMETCHSLSTKYFLKSCLLS